MTTRLNKKSLPESWAWSTIGAVTDVIMGQSPPGDTYNQDGNGIALINGPVEFGPTPFSKTLQTKFTTQPTKLCEQDDLILCVRGSTTGRMNIAGSQACIGRGVAAIRAKIDQTYISIFVHSMQQEIYEMGTGSTFPNISSDNIKSIKIPLAPLNEQQRIVEAIETQFTRLDAAVAALKRSQANLKRYRAAVLKAACEGRLVPTEAELAQAEGRSYEPAAVLLERILAERRCQWEAENPKKKYQEPVAPDTSALPELPEGWCWTRMEQLADLVSGVTKGRNFNGKQTVSLPYLRVANVQQGWLDLAEVKYIEALPEDQDRYHLEVNDLLLTEGGDLDKLGRSAIWRGQVNDCIHQNHIFRARPFHPDLSTTWLMYNTNSQQGRTYFMNTGKQTTNLASINLTQLRGFPVPLPPFAEQQRIVAEVERRLSLIDQLEKTIEADLARANRLRQSILKRAFAGQLVPQDPHDEPAAVLLERIQAAKNGKPVQSTLPITA